MHYAISLALPVGLMLFFSFLFQPARAAPPVFPRLARHAGDHEARPSHAAIECHAVGIDEVRNPLAVTCIQAVQCRFSAPGTAGIQVGPSGYAGIGTANPVDNLQVGSLASTSTATPVTLSLGGTYSSTAGANPKLKIYDNGTQVYGFGSSGSSLDMIAASGGTFDWWNKG